MHEKHTTEADKKIEQFVNEALAFNKKHNIFVRESFEEVYEKDVYDCLPVLEKINNSDKILDLGSGGGFPGMIIAIAKPMCEIHLLEKSKKKCYFLNKTIDLLGLKNVTVLNTVINKNNNLGSYTLITARAFSSTANILELSQNNLNNGGKYVLLKGKKEKITEELVTIDTNKYKYEIIKLENKKYERHLVEIKKVNKVIAIANQKGGVGKTTTAVNLASSLSATKRRVLLIDLDPQGNATTATGIKKEKPNTLYDLFFNNTPINECIYSTSDNYKVLPGDQNLIALDVGIRENNKQNFLSTELKKIDNEFDYTIIDTPPTLNQLTIEALFAASGTLIPLQCEYYSLEGVAGLMQTIQTLSDKNLTSNRVLGIIRTMVDMRNNLAKEVSDELEKHFSNLVFNTLIPRNIKLAEAPSHGVSGVKYMPTSYGAKAYLALAGELIRKVEYV